ncbi:hypothetical protein ISF12_10220 [Pseudomonas aeruginosa]|nr:hypothetical protein [Pseudomonas aeruginosa]
MHTSDPAIDIAARLEALAGALRSVRELAPSHVIRGVFYDASGNELDCDPSDRFATALATWDSADDSENGTVLRFPGLVELTPKLMTAVARLNACKRDLEAIVEFWQSGDEGLSARQMRNHYASAGYARIHPLQTWRQVVQLDSRMIDQPLASVGFTVQQRGNSSEEISLQDAITRLLNANAYDLVDRLESDKIPDTAKVKWYEPVGAHIRANVVWGAKESAVRDQFHASLPLCVGAGGWPTKRVRFNAPKEKAQAVRSDSQGAAPRYPLPFRSGAFIQVA